MGGHEHKRCSSTKDCVQRVREATKDQSDIDAYLPGDIKYTDVNGDDGDDVVCIANWLYDRQFEWKAGDACFKSARYACQLERSGKYNNKTASDPDYMDCLYSYNNVGRPLYLN